MSDDHAYRIPDDVVARREAAAEILAAVSDPAFLEAISAHHYTLVASGPGNLPGYRERYARRAEAIARVLTAIGKPAP